MAAHVAEIVRREKDASVSRTGYTVQIETETRRYFFADAGTSQNCFRAYGKLKADIGAHEARVMSEGGPEAIVQHADPGSVLYHRVPVSGGLPSSCWCVDIRAAYPTTLRNMGVITDETYSWCMRNLSKPDRLKAVGMLAGSKFVQVFRDGKLSEQRRENNPLRPWFFDVCAYVGQVMQDIAEAQGTAFVFFWVDGIFLDVPDPGPIVEALASYGYEATAERVERIRWSAGGKYILFRKGGKDTYLCVPRRLEVDEDEILASIHRAKRTRPNSKPKTKTDERNEARGRPVLASAEDVRSEQIPGADMFGSPSDHCPF